MSGDIIDFRSLREQRRAKLYRQQPVPRAPAGEPVGFGGTPARWATIDEQVVRILSLLGELKALTRDPRDLPLPLLARARASIDMTSQVFGQVLGAVCVEPEEDGSDDPQPEVDREVLERMYRDLDLQA
jgi:hypothetical protein